MPYKVQKDIEACSTAEPFAVKKQSDGKIMGCHASREKANRQVAALYANEANMIDQDFNFEDSHLFELFLADGETEQSEDGLFWKDILKEGTWSYRPGPGQKPIPIPLKIVSGHSETREEIGMADLVNAFEEGAIDHVTVPTSHDDKPQDNTGYVRKLKVVERDGKQVLRAGIDFTEPEIKGKAARGTIANTSSGIVFDYIKKDSGKTYKAVLGHVALTNKPWLNGMKPFGVAASEDYSEEEITTLMLEDVVWDNSKSMTWLRDSVHKSIQNQQPDSQCYVMDVMPGRALVAKLSNGGKQSNYVVPFQIRNNEVKIAAQDRWIGAAKEWVKASMDNLNYWTGTTTGNVTFPSITTSTTDFIDFGPMPESVKDANNTEPNEGGKGMDSDKSKERKEEKQETPSDNPAPASLSDDARKELTDQLRTEFSEQYDGVAEENEKLRKQVHEMKVKERIEELKKLGLGEHPGLLSEIQKLMLADDGKPALVLSEQDDGEDKKVSLSASEIIERLIDALPKKDDKIVLSEQALITEDENRPPATPDVDENTPVDERIDNFAEELGIANFPKRETVKTNTGGDA